MPAGGTHLETAASKTDVHLAWSLLPFCSASQYFMIGRRTHGSHFITAHRASFLFQGPLPQHSESARGFNKIDLNDFSKPEYKLEALLITG